MCSNKISHDGCKDWCNHWGNHRKYIFHAVIVFLFFLPSTEKTIHILYNRVFFPNFYKSAHFLKNIAILLLIPMLSFISNVASTYCKAMLPICRCFKNLSRVPFHFLNTIVDFFFINSSSRVKVNHLN